MQGESVNISPPHEFMASGKVVVSGACVEESANIHTNMLGVGRG